MTIIFVELAIEIDFHAQRKDVYDFVIDLIKDNKKILGYAIHWDKEFKQ